MKKKECTKCGQDKPLDQYYNNTRAPDGLTYSCKQCKSEYQRRLREGEIEPDVRLVGEGWRGLVIDVIAIAYRDAKGDNHIQKQDALRFFDDSPLYQLYMEYIGLDPGIKPKDLIDVSS